MTSIMAVPQNTTLIISLIVFLAVFYFIIIAYSLIQKYGLLELFQKIFIISIKRIKYAFSAYFILIFIGFLVFLILSYSFTIGYLLALILFLIVFLPYLTVSRIFSIRIMNEMEKEK
ncbi:hypothetical protein HYU07_00585 [Candidatus Woesearchaeota archaeon]|nr:hypothetical protein [Candidatus Woesearchaeota archaeon]